MKENTKRRDYGTGTITSSADGKKHQLKWYVKKDKKYHYETFCGSPRDARLRLSEITIAVRNGAFISPTKFTVQQAFDKWIIHKQNYIRLRTLDDYIARMDYVLSKLGEKSLSELSAIDIQDWVDQALINGSKLNKPLAPVTVRQAFVVFKGMLQFYEDKNIIGKNPAAKITLPRVDPRDFKKMTPEQMEQLMDGISGYKYECCARIALHLGLRREEVLSLTWNQDIDFEKRTLSIDKTLVKLRHIKRGLHVDIPKSKNSYRVLPMPSILIDYLISYKEKQEKRKLKAGSAWEDKNLVCDNGLGGYIDPDNLSREWKLMVARAKVPHMRFHDLRHNFCELLRDVTDTKAISMLAGHSTTQITDSIYLHQDDTIERNAVDRIWMKRE